MPLTRNNGAAAAEELVSAPPVENAHADNTTLGVLKCLPGELVLGIFAWVPPIDIWRSRTVCKQWRTLTHDETLWRTICHMRYTPPLRKPAERSWEWVCRSKSIDLTVGARIKSAGRKVGFFKRQDGIHYEGDFVGDLKHGYGITIFPERGRYEGLYVDGKYTGHGCFTWNDGSIYEGVWLNNERHGWGQYQWANGKVYKGEWQNDKATGWGHLTYAVGDHYKGQFTNGFFSFGMYTWEREGDIYVGAYLGELRHGQGLYQWPDGRKYIGSWRKDMHDGSGSYEWPDGAIYSGEWLKDERHGQGRMMWADGTVYDGKWFQDSQVNAAMHDREWDRFFKKTGSEQRQFMREYLQKVDANKKMKGSKRKLEDDGQPEKSNTLKTR